MSEDNDDTRDRTRRTDDEFPEPNRESPLNLGARIGDRAELSSFDPAAAAAGDPFNIGPEDDDDDRVDLDDCPCGWPKLTVDTAEVGPALVQVLYCQRCDYRFATVSGGAAGDE